MYSKRDNQRIQGSGVFFLIKDQDRLYTILFKNVRRNGINLQDAGGYLDVHLDYKTNACKELLEESCCSLIIDPEDLQDNNSIVIDNRYITYFIYLSADIELLKVQLTNIYRENRNRLQQSYKATRVKDLKCYLETFQVTIIDFNELVSLIQSKPITQSVFIKQNGQSVELHRRTQNIILESSRKQSQFQFNYKHTIKILTRNQTTCELLVGNSYLSIQETQIDLVQLRDNPVLQGSGVMIFIFDKGDLYLILFRKNKDTNDYLIDAGGSCIDGLILENAIRQTSEDSCGVFQIHQSTLQDQLSVIANHRYKSYCIIINMCVQLTQLQASYFHNRQQLQKVDLISEPQTKNYLTTSGLILVDVRFLEQNFRNQNYELIVDCQCVRLHPRTIAVIEELKDKNFFNYLQKNQHNQINLSIRQNQFFPALEGLITYSVQ